MIRYSTALLMMSSESYGKLKYVDLRLYIRNNFLTVGVVMLDMTYGISSKERLTHICVVQL